MADVEIVLPVAMPVPTPTEYTGVAPQLAVGYRLSDDGTKIVYSASMTVRFYGRLENGMIVFAPDQATRTYNVGDVQVEIDAETPVGQVAGKILEDLRAGLMLLAAAGG